MFVVEVQTAGKDNRASVAEDFSAKFSTSKWAKELVTFSAYSQKSEGLFLLESYWPVCVWGEGVFVFVCLDDNFWAKCL